ncbi:uncharacterized protein [Panulirus ornatus]|uniref:uncharacterized protein n=1 Tax=Panulirus ornatus TaxID=150431 RepID=UPI003A87E9B1
MVIQLLQLIILQGLAGAVPDLNCSLHLSCHPDDLVPHPWDCHLYHVCLARGVPDFTTQRCPLGQYFDPTGRTCVQEESPCAPACPHPCHCDLLGRGRVVHDEHRCQQGRLLHMESNQCIDTSCLKFCSHKAGLAVTGTDTGAIASSKSLNRTIRECYFTCHGDFSTYADKNSCSKFYVCYPGGIGIQQFCPTDRPYFNGVDCISDSTQCCVQPPSSTETTGTSSTIQTPSTEPHTTTTPSTKYPTTTTTTPSTEHPTTATTTPSTEPYTTTTTTTSAGPPTTITKTPSTEPPTTTTSTEPPTTTTTAPSTEPPTTTITTPSTESPTSATTTPSTEPPTTTITTPSTEPPTTTTPSTEPPTTITTTPSTESPTSATTTPSTEPPTTTTTTPSTEPPITKTTTQSTQLPTTTTTTPSTEPSTTTTTTPSTQSSTTTTTTTTTRTTTTTTAPSISCLLEPDCRDKPMGSAVPDPNNCLRYYVCLGDDIATEDSFPCQPGLYFNPETNKCHLIEGDTYLCLPPCTSMCSYSCLDSEWIFDPKNCSRYYLCYQGSTVHLSCSTSRPYFDGQACTAHPDSCCFYPCPPYCPYQGKMVPHGKDCHKYYICLDVGFPTNISLITCRNNEVFDHVTGQCSPTAECIQLCED